MNSLFTEITDSEATSVVGGLKLPPGGFYVPQYPTVVYSTANGLASADTTFIDTGYTFAKADTAAISTDVSSFASSSSKSGIVYSQL